MPPRGTATFGAGKLEIATDSGDAVSVTCSGGVKVNGIDPVPAASCGSVTSIAVVGDDLPNSS